MSTSIVTETSPASSPCLVRLREVKDEFGIADTASDTKLLRWATATSVRFANACGRTFAAASVSETFREVYGRGLLILSRHPVIEVASVTEAGEAVATDGYEVDPGAGLLYRLAGDCRTCWRARTIVVAYRAGFDPIPADVTDAVLTVMRHRWATSDRDPLLRSFSIDGVGREDYWVPLQGGDTAALPPDLLPVADTIAHYRQVGI
ncbi:MAG: hypothetical protein WDN25_03970 [Acetobacteraceae bacterium]